MDYLRRLTDQLWEIFTDMSGIILRLWLMGFVMLFIFYIIHLAVLSLF